jgi:hypothetical protein
LDRETDFLYYIDVEKVTPAGIKIVNRQGEGRVLPYDTFIIARERVALEGYRWRQ